MASLNVAEHARSVRTPGREARTDVATSDKSKIVQNVPVDLLPVIRASGVLSERQFAEIRSKVLAGDLPSDSQSLADRLVLDKILTDYQVKRLLANKPNGLLVGKYVILDRIGSGAMGRVYKAHHLMMGRDVALKIIAPEIVSNERAVARFRREMRLVGRLDHPNVVRAYDADQVNNVLFIVMEYVQGTSLGQRLKQGPMSPAEVVNYAAQAALGLAHAHYQGVVHRDIKPSNLLVNEDRQVKVLDLGLGVLMESDNSSTFATADNIAVGTVDYMSPEQALGKDVDGRSDLYSLGCAMYHLMTGRLAFPGDSPIERLGKRINGRPVPIQQVRKEIPSSVVAVLDRLMAHSPADRYQTATEASEALSGLMKRPRKALTSHDPSSVGPTSNLTAPASSVGAPAPLLPPPPPQIVHVRPPYPRWFKPMASLAEKRPKSALAVVVGVLLGSTLLGLIAGKSL